MVTKAIRLMEDNFGTILDAAPVKHSELTEALEKYDLRTPGKAIFFFVFIPSLEGVVPDTPTWTLVPEKGFHAYYTCEQMDKIRSEFVEIIPR